MKFFLIFLENTQRRKERAQRCERETREKKSKHKARKKIEEKKRKLKGKMQRADNNIFNKFAFMRTMKTTTEKSVNREIPPFFHEYKKKRQQA